jgi:hypothetical protein
MKNIKHLFSNVSKCFILFLMLKITHQHYENESKNLKREKNSKNYFNYQKLLLKSHDFQFMNNINDFLS